MGLQEVHFFFLSFFFFGTGAACRILIPQPEIEPRSLAVKATGPKHQGIPKTHIFLIDYSDSILLWSQIFPLYIISSWEVTQSCLTLYDPMDYTVHGILQARILEWVAFPFSRGSSQPRNQTGVCCIAGEFFTSWAIREAHLVLLAAFICCLNVLWGQCGVWIDKQVNK